MQEGKFACKALKTILRKASLYAEIILKTATYVSGGDKHQMSSGRLGLLRFVTECNVLMSPDVTSGVSSYETTERPLRDAGSVCCVLRSSGTDGAWHSKLNRRNLGLSLCTLTRLANPDVFFCEARRE